ncbi:hypothetical protein [Leyella stercorea]|uniref:hypothetical protein n=1 Tax=Leyella stercorea TaxID=363265 RepID=UPI00243083B0|nr:hypothetical protein [Leyella stercorea]
MALPSELLVANIVATLPQHRCHATETSLPRYNNSIATLQQLYCHATETSLSRYRNIVVTLL